MSEPAVEFVGVSKRFRRGESHDSLADLVASSFKRFLRLPVAERSAFWALNDVSFRLDAGAAVGIIGPNGAGKSTVLKLLAGILHPDAGRLAVSRRLAALIEVGAGFHGDLTGRENVFLNGTILGMTRAEIRRKLDSIVAFAGLEANMDTPVKRYSSGMYARLGFSIAAHVEPDVLLVDEVLSVGDAVFRLRCLDRMRQLVRGGTTLVFVTHDLDQMQSICSRAIVLDHGRVAFDGNSQDAVSHYMQTLSSTYAQRPCDLSHEHSAPANDIECVELRLLDENSREVIWARPDAALRLAIGFRAKRAVPRLVIEANLRAGEGRNVISLNSARSDEYCRALPGDNQAIVAISSLPIAGGPYLWNVRMWDADSGATLVDTPFRFPLVINDGGKATGSLCLAHAWEFASYSAPTLRSRPSEPDAPTRFAVPIEEVAV